MSNKTKTNEIKSEFYDRFSSSICINESRLISYLWQNPTKFYDCDLEFSDFFDRNFGTIYYIGYEMMKTGKFNSLKDLDQEIDSFLSSHDKTREVWESEAREVVSQIWDVTWEEEKKNKIDDIVDYYVQKIKKYKVLRRLMEKKILIIDKDNYKDYEEMSLDEIYDEYSAHINNIFSSVEVKTKTYNIYDNIEENIQKWNKGAVMGLEIDGLPDFSKITGGIPDSGVSLIGAGSNMGKSSLLRDTVFPKFIPDEEDLKEIKKAFEEGMDYQSNKKAIIFLNEESLEKWQRELLVWIINNRLEVLDEDKNKNFVHKYQDKNQKWCYRYCFPKGKFKEAGFLNFSDISKLLIRGTEWMKKNIPENHILILPLIKFSTKGTIKEIKKYCVLGYKNFIIDTFKMDNTDDAKIDNTVRIQLIQNMTHLYNLAKEDAYNVRVICTVQLAKAYSLQRYLSQESLAESKNMIDVCGYGIFMRKVWEDEKQGGSHCIPVYKWGTIENEANAIYLDVDKQYVILFCVKTREGELDKQCVAEVDWGTNTLKEIGYCRINPD